MAMNSFMHDYLADKLREAEKAVDDCVESLRIEGPDQLADAVDLKKATEIIRTMMNKFRAASEKARRKDS